MNKKSLIIGLIIAAVPGAGLAFGVYLICKSIMEDNSGDKNKLDQFFDNILNKEKKYEKEN